MNQLAKHTKDATDQGKELDVLDRFHRVRLGEYEALMEKQKREGETAEANLREEQSAAERNAELAATAVKSVETELRLWQVLYRKS
jgi:hypothetical protein